MKLAGKVTISRASDDLVYISFQDEKSGIEFAEAVMSIEQFGYAITNLAYRTAEIEVRGLQYVGKRYERQARSIAYPHKSNNREAMRQWLLDNAIEDGWMVDSYLGSQTSIGYKDGKTILNYAVFRYVDDAEAA